MSVKMAGLMTLKNDTQPPVTLVSLAGRLFSPLPNDCEEAVENRWQECANHAS